MNRGLLRILIPAGSLVAGIVLICAAMGSRRFSDCLTDDGGFDRLKEGREYREHLATEVVFNEEKLLYDEEADTWYYSLTQGDRKAQDPSVSVRSEDGDVRLAVLGGPISLERIRDNAEWTLLFYNDQFYDTAALKCTTLPLLSVETWQALPEETKDPVDMRLTLYDNRKSAVRRRIVSDGTIHLRGVTTLTDPKKSYRISLKETSLGQNTRNSDRSLLGMRRDDDWILYAAGRDPEMIRNVFCSELWTQSCGTDNRLHVQTGVEYQYVELILNGRYAGLYALGNPLQRGQFLIGEDPKQSVLYKIYEDGDENCLTLDETGKVLGHEAVSAAEGAYDPWEMLREYYVFLGENRENKDRLLEGIDLDNAVDFWLFVNLIQGMDNVDNNQYLALRKDNGTISGLYAPWDMDITWGNGFYREAYVFSPEEDFIPTGGYLYQLLYDGDAGIRERVRQKYEQLRAGAWSDERITGMIREAQEEIFGSGAFRRDSDRWPEVPHQDAEDGLRVFEDYVLKRLAVFDRKMEGSLFEELTEEYPVSFTMEMDGMLDLHDRLNDPEGACYCLEILNPAIWQDTYYRTFYDTLHIPENMRMSGADKTRTMLEELSPDAPLTDDVDALFWKAGEENVQAVRGLHVSGFSQDLSVGQVQYYEDGEGQYWIYLDAQELITGNRTGPDAPDFRLLLFYPEEGETEILDEWKSRVGE